MKNIPQEGTKTQPKMKLVDRGDSGFFVGELLDYLESVRGGYLIKVKMKNLMGLMARHKWEAVKGNPGWEQAAFPVNF